MARRFSLKFQQIVEQEQDSNFISRLHGGKLDIIPWPVIESKEFYKLFAILKRRLDMQNISHPTAGEFLHTIKTLMAKIKVAPIFVVHITFSAFSSNRPMIGVHFPVCHSAVLSGYCIYSHNRDYGRASCQIARCSPADGACDGILGNRTSA